MPESKDESDKVSGGGHRLNSSNGKHITVSIKSSDPYKTVHHAKTEDLSCSGLSFFVVSGIYFKIGDLIPEVEITIPGAPESVQAECEVRTITGNKVGVIFKNQTEKQKDIITKYLVSYKDESLAKILLVEDQPIPQIIIGGFLKKSKYFVTIAKDGEEGVIKAINELPDLILMDMNMPKMNGCEACKQIKQDPRTKDIPVLMLTSSQDKDTVIRAIQAGANDYIIKSDSQLPLLNKVKEALKKRC